MMLSDYKAYIEWLLTTLADFLSEPPIVYVVALVITSIVVKIFLSLIKQ